MSNEKEVNEAAIEFMRLIKPLIDKASELGIVDADTMEFTADSKLSQALIQIISSFMQQQSW
jgi:hypothetical protein